MYFTGIKLIKLITIKKNFDFIEIDLKEKFIHIKIEDVSKSNLFLTPNFIICQLDLEWPVKHMANTLFNPKN